MTLEVPRNAVDITVYYNSIDYSDPSEPEIQVNLSTGAYISFPGEDQAELVKLLIKDMDEFREYLNTKYSDNMLPDSDVNIEWQTRDIGWYNLDSNNEL